jgi:transposase-like protein
VKLTLKSLRKRVGNDEAIAYEVLEELRWGVDRDRLACPHCGHDRAYFLKPKTGEARITGPVRKSDGQRSISVRRVWKCAACRRKFSVLTGTIFHATKIPIADWLQVLVLASSAKNGIAGREVERLIGVTPETAWHMLHRIREAMKREPMVGMMRGVVVADETFIGGKPKNRHQQGKARMYSPGGSGKRGGPFEGKTAVLSLVSGGEVRSQVVPDVTGATLRKVIAEQVDMAASTLHTDAGKQYRPLGQEFAEHEFVDHSEREYVRGAVTTNPAEGYFSQLKRSLDGTHHHVSREHLPRYLAEFDFRYSTRKLTDADRLQRVVDQADGRRLSYKPLTERG